MIHLNEGRLLLPQARRVGGPWLLVPSTKLESTPKESQLSPITQVHAAATVRHFSQLLLPLSPGYRRPLVAKTRDFGIIPDPCPTSLLPDPRDSRRLDLRVSTTIVLHPAPCKAAGSCSPRSAVHPRSFRPQPIASIAEARRRYWLAQTSPRTL
jgi:hypothetical protein